MSLTSKQIDELRAYAADRKGELAKLISDAADTIEMLSAKLHASQMERSSQYYHGGWIPCSERMPEEHDSIWSRFKGTDRFDKVMWKKQSDNVLVTELFEDGTVKTDTATTHDGEWYVKIRAVKRKITAWMPLPEPWEGKQ